MGIERTAEIAAKKPWTTLLIWIALIGLCAFLIINFLPSALTTSQSLSVETESQKAENLRRDRLGGSEQTTEIIIVKSDQFVYTDQEFRNFTLALQKKLTDLGSDNVLSNISYYQTNNRGFISNSGNSALIITNLPGQFSEVQDQLETVQEVVQESETESFQVFNSGVASVNQDFQEISEKDLTQAEIFGLPIALIILILVFGAITAAVLPMLLSFLSIALALAATAALGQISNLSFFVTNMITMMGLAVGIDYSLFIISRFREERAAGLEKLPAIKKSSATAGKAIFFSGITVVIALSGLLFIPSNIFRSLSLGAILVVLAAVLAALTLLPALLSLLGDKINRFSIPFLGGKPDAVGQKGFWLGVSNFVMKWAWIALPLTAGILIWASIPLVAINIGESGVSNLPEELPSKKGFEILENEFSSGLLSPTEIVIGANIQDIQVQEAIRDLEGSLNQKDEISQVSTETYPDQNLAIINVPISAGNEKSKEIVNEIRSDLVLNAFEETESQVFVGGQTAQNLDFNKIIEDYTPLVFSFVLGLSFILLMLVFRSIVVPIKAIIMNLLSVGAAYGIMVAVFQFGIGNEIFGFSQTEQIEAWIPLFLFAILFGLSMDYHVFLLSRIRERFLKTKDNTDAVGYGLSTTGRLITGAALIMVAVFAAFASGSLVMFQQMGFGLALAILLDATIVRTVLVPASMKLLGSANWYFPNFLSWLPKIGIEG